MFNWEIRGLRTFKCCLPGNRVINFKISRIAKPGCRSLSFQHFETFVAGRWEWRLEIEAIMKFDIWWIRRSRCGRVALKGEKWKHCGENAKNWDYLEVVAIYGKWLPFSITWRCSRWLNGNYKNTTLNFKSLIKEIKTEKKYKCVCNHRTCFLNGNISVSTKVATCSTRLNVFIVAPTTKRDKTQITPKSPTTSNINSKINPIERPI